MSEIADLYRGPLSEFVARRDARMKELRSAGDRAAATEIKAVRKPSRLAWALDLASVGEPFNILIDAVRVTTAAQSRGVDVREAVTGLREAIREFAQHAASIAKAEGERLDENSLVSAVFAVLGDSSSFQQLQRGELADIPEAGGLDSLANLTLTPKLTLSSGVAKPHGADAGRSASASADEAAARAAKELAELRKASDDALRALTAADSDLAIAEARLEEAARALESARRNRATAAANAEAAMQRVKKAQPSTRKKAASPRKA